MLKSKLKNKLSKLKEKITLKQFFTFGIVLIIIGVILFSSDYLYMKVLKIFDDMNYKIFLNTQDNNHKNKNGIDTNNLDSAQIKSQEKDNSSAGVYNYIAMLEIPKLELKRGLVSKGTAANNVSRNIMTLKESSYPNIEKGNLILAAHSGSGYNAYFRNLYKLNNKDIVNVYYNNVKYTYEIKNIYLQDKIGKLVIYRDKSKTTLTMITCTKNNRKKQTVYIAELVSMVEY